MDKILSVIIPTYNMEKYLDKCLTSLIISDKELMKQLEVLVIIDGAKDRSSEIAHSYQDKYQDIFRVIDKENGNYGSCINRGLKEATGKYVKVLDADDYYDSNILLLYLKFLACSNVDLVVNAMNTVSPTGKVFKKKAFNLRPGISLPFSVLSSAMREYMGMHCVAFNTDKLRTIGYVQTEGISYTDQEWIFMPMTTVKSLGYFDGFLYQYLVGREDQTINPEVVLRSINHKIIVAKSMISNFLNYTKEDLDMTNYLIIRLVFCLKEIYQIILGSNNESSVQVLVEFDEYIKQQCIELYSKLNDVSISPFVHVCFIKKWRQDNSYRLSSFEKKIAKVSTLLVSVKRLIMPKI